MGGVPLQKWCGFPRFAQGHQYGVDISWWKLLGTLVSRSPLGLEVYPGVPQVRGLLCCFCVQVFFCQVGVP